MIVAYFSMDKLAQEKLLIWLVVKVKIKEFFLELWQIYLKIYQLIRIKENPTKWQKEHNEFINSQFAMHEEFVKRLLQTPSGEAKLQKLREVKLQKH